MVNNLKEVEEKVRYWADYILMRENSDDFYYSTKDSMLDRDELDFWRSELRRLKNLG